MDLSIVVLAAGQGTRMKSPLPKVLHVIGGKPMLSHVISTAQMLSPSQIVVVFGFGGETIKEKFQHSNLVWAEQPKLQGTGDAVAKAIPLIPSHHRVLILYGDVPLITAQTLRRLLNATPADTVGLLTVNTSDPTGLGRIVRDENAAVKRIVEERDANDIERQIHEVNTGIFMVSAKQLTRWLPQLKNNNNQGEYYLTDIIQLAVQDNVPIVTAFPSTPQEVLGVNDRSQQAAAERYYQRYVAEQLLREGVWICDPDRFDLRGKIQAQADVTIDVNVVFEGNIILGKGCRIGPNCVVINSELGDNVKVLANSYLEDVKVDNDCVIGPFARLRPGTVLSSKVRVGNFVEVKNSIVGEGSKINHLSYVGDTLMGKDVNIGAGTITCNYDGAHKHQTIIEDNVSIGSDSQLIAPIRVGKGATIGAGSTLSKDAPASQLTLTHQLHQRSHQWTRPTKESSNPLHPHSCKTTSEDLSKE